MKERGEERGGGEKREEEKGGEEGRGRGRE